MSPSLLVGIAGGTASGKTTLARRLAQQRSDVLLLTHDRYYLDVSDPVGHNYDHPDALDNALLVSHLRGLIAGRVIEAPDYDFASHCRRPVGVDVAPQPIVLVEGILVLAIPELRELFGFTVFVDAPDELRLSRRIARDRAQRGRTEASVLEQYRATVAPMHTQYVAPSARGVDLLLDGAGDIGVELSRLNEGLNARLANRSP